MSELCTCGQPVVVLPPRLEQKARDLHASLVERGLRPVGDPYTGPKRCASCVWRVIESMDDEEVNAPGGTT